MIQNVVANEVNLTTENVNVAAPEDEVSGEANMANRSEGRDGDNSSIKYTLHVKIHSFDDSQLDLSIFELFGGHILYFFTNEHYD